jgi:hypothetical protein
VLVLTVHWWPTPFGWAISPINWACWQCFRFERILITFHPYWRWYLSGTS